MKLIFLTAVAYGLQLEANPIRRVVNMLQAMAKKM